MHSIKVWLGSITITFASCPPLEPLCNWVMIEDCMEPFRETSVPLIINILEWLDEMMLFILKPVFLIYLPVF